MVEVQGGSKRRRDDDDTAAEELASLNADDADHHERPQQQPATEHNDNATAGDSQRVAALQAKLQHLRRWMRTLQQTHLQQYPEQKDAVQNARRLFIGSLPEGTTEEELAGFLGAALTRVGGVIADSGQPVAYCRVQRERSFAFVELRSAEEASNCMALDGLLFKGVPLKVKRPSKYDAQHALLLGPIEPDPSLDLSAVQIAQPQPTTPAAGPAAAGGEGRPHGKHQASWNTLYVGGLPMEWSTEQCLDLLRKFGQVQHFKLMFDRLTGASRGFGFVEYTTDEATLAALQALDGAQLSNRRITANRMLQHKQQQQQLQHQAHQHQQQFQQQLPPQQQQQQQQVGHMQHMGGVPAIAPSAQPHMQAGGYGGALPASNSSYDAAAVGEGILALSPHSLPQVLGQAPPMAAAGVGPMGAGEYGGMQVPPTAGLQQQQPQQPPPAYAPGPGDAAAAGMMASSQGMVPGGFDGPQQHVYAGGQQAAGGYGGQAYASQLQQQQQVQQQQPYSMVVAGVYGVQPGSMYPSSQVPAGPLQGAPAAGAGVGPGYVPLQQQQQQPQPLRQPDLPPEAMPAYSAAMALGGQLGMGPQLLPAVPRAAVAAQPVPGMGMGAPGSGPLSTGAGGAGAWQAAQHPQPQPPPPQQAAWMPGAHQQMQAWS